MMEFSLESARLLRESLPAIDFNAPIAGGELVASYLSHYNLDRLNVPWSYRHSLGSFDSLSFQLVCQYFALPDKNRRGTVLIVHGYYDHAGLFRHAIENCLSQGYSVLAFDLPGHGLSSGDPASIASFDHYSQALVDCLEAARIGGLSGPWHVIAQSTGAAAVINGLLNEVEYPLAGLDKIVLLAPLLRPADWRNGLWKYYLIRWFVRQVKRDFASNSHDEEFLRFIYESDPLQARFLMVDWVRSLKSYLQRFKDAAVCNVPVHIVQGTEDTTVDWRYNLPRLATKFPAAETHIVAGARHHLVNESAEYRNQVFEIVRKIFNST